MTICYECDNQFYGDECPSCGWEVEYSCWNCGDEITPANNNKHYTCGWFECNACGECGCSSARPPSNEEKRGY